MNKTLKNILECLLGSILVLFFAPLLSPISNPWHQIYTEPLYWAFGILGCSILTCIIIYFVDINPRKFYYCLNIVPIIILLIFILIISTITDILYIGFDNEDEIDMEKELAYYDTEYNEENDKNEVVEFFKSVWDFVAGLFSGGMAEDTDWPVERTLHYYKLFWK